MFSINPLIDFNTLSSAAYLPQMREARKLYNAILDDETQDATKLKGEGFAQMELWMRRFYSVAHVAVRDRPQLLETLGVYVKS